MKVGDRMLLDGEPVWLADLVYLIFARKKLGWWIVQHEDGRRRYVLACSLEPLPRDRRTAHSEAAPSAVRRSNPSDG